MLLLSDGLVLLVSLHELLANLIGVGKLAALEPWVSDDVWDGQSLMRVEVQHSSDQVLELLIEEAIRLAIGVSRPELLRAVRRNQLVVRILQIGHVERWMTGIQDEQNDTKGEKIDDLALIGLLGVDLGRHEAERADNTPVHSVASSAFNWACEAEIDDFDIIELVKEDIFTFEVTVRESLSVNVVDGLDELLGVVAHNLLVEGARVGNIVEELASMDKLAHDVSNLHLLTILFVMDGAFIELEVFDDMLVVERLD